MPLTFDDDTAERLRRYLDISGDELRGYADRLGSEPAVADSLRRLADEADALLETVEIEIQAQG